MFKKFKSSLEDIKTHYGIGLKLATNDFSRKLNSIFVDKEFFDDEFFEEIEEKLIELDIVPKMAIVITQKLEERIYNQRVSVEKFNIAFKEVIKEIIKDDPEELKVVDDTLNIFFIVGINGVGKTTTISKLANKFKNYNTELVAGDTFRAGAIDQLSHWANVVDLPIVKTHQGHAPSAVMYDAITSAKENDRDLLICDTAGRLHNKDQLMEELKKMHQVIEKNCDVDYNLKTILVLDGTAGKNTIEQARVFNEITKLDGVIITKMDANAKVGIILNIIYELNVPIYFITTGEQLEDIREFDYDSYLEMLFDEN